MKIVTQARQSISGWMDAVAAGIVAVLTRFESASAVRLVEDKSGAFVLHGPGRGSPSEPIQIVEGRATGPVSADMAAKLRGSRAELVLKSDRFLFRPLELPKRAAEFLDGIVRAQIDRLTPWSAGDAVFGWSKPNETGPDRIGVTVAATARDLVTPYVRALAELGAKSVSILTLLPDAGAGAAPVKVLEERPGGGLNTRRIRTALMAVLIIALLTSAAAVGTAAILANDLDARQEEVARRIAARRAALRAAGDTALDPVTAAQRSLERRKHDSASSVIALEALSQILPDHTYVTELRIEGDKLRVIGLTRDAPSLIRLMEQSPHFTRATFFAPTTRSQEDTGERFHIEARLEPVFAPRS